MFRVQGLEGMDLRLKVWGSYYWAFSPCTLSVVCIAITKLQILEAVGFRVGGLRRPTKR